MFCERCDRAVVIYAVSRGAASAEDLEAIRAAARAAGQEVLFNPPPIGPYRCPRCRGPLRVGGASAEGSTED